MFVDFDERARPVGRLHHPVAFGPCFHYCPMHDGEEPRGAEHTISDMRFRHRLFRRTAGPPQRRHDRDFYVSGCVALPARLATPATVASTAHHTRAPPTTGLGVR